MKKYLIGIFLIHTTQITLAATDCNLQTCRYVRAGANGNGSDWANAYGFLPDTLSRGTIYFIAAGTYPGHRFGDPISGTTPITILKAIPTDHGTTVGWSDTYGTGQAHFKGQFDFVTSNWIIDGQTGGGATNNWNQNFGFKITEIGDSNAIIRIGYNAPVNNITIRHVDFQGKGSVSNQGGGYSNDAMAIYQANNITLSYYWMHGIGRCPFFTGGQNVLAEHGWIQSYFQSNEVHSEVASIWKISSGTLGDHTFRNNLITDIEGTGGLMWDNSSNPASHMYVYGNVFYKPSGTSWMSENGLIGGWTTNAASFTNVRVYNNTFINIDQQSLSTFPSVYSNNIVSNNLFYNCESPDFSRFGSHDYNHFINSGGTHLEMHGSSASSGNPFANFVGLDFRLIADTAAGSVLSAPFNLDPLGAVRGSDGNFDRGAFEFIGGQGNPPSPVLLAAPANLRLISK